MELKLCKGVLSFQVCSLLVQSEGEKKVFFVGCKKEGADCEIFVKFEIFLPHFCFLLDAFYK